MTKATNTTQPKTTARHAMPHWRNHPDWTFGQCIQAMGETEASSKSGQKKSASGKR